MQTIKRITISEVEEKIKELREIEHLLNYDEYLKVINAWDCLNIKEINENLNKIIIDAGVIALKNEKIKILEELGENGIVEHSIEPLEK